MTVRNKGLGWSQRMKWDSHNRLAEMSGAGVSEGYVYDASGQRIRKANLLPPNNLTWAPFANYKQTGSDSSTATRYYSFGGAVVAMRSGSGCGFSFLYQDGVNSTVYTTDFTGNITSARGYYAFGGFRFSEGTMPTDRHFTGQREDTTGLYYYGARYYDPQLGQFLSPDTVVPDPTQLIDYNRYLYARGNPLKYNDPTGHDPHTTDGGGSAPIVSPSTNYATFATYYSIANFYHMQDGLGNSCLLTSDWCLSQVAIRVTLI